MGSHRASRDPAQQVVPRAETMAPSTDDAWKINFHNVEKLTDNVEYNSAAREWRCKWSEDNSKSALVECQKVLDDVVVPSLKHLHGLLSVQRVVCGECKVEAQSYTLTPVLGNGK